MSLTIQEHYILDLLLVFGNHIRMGFKFDDAVDEATHIVSRKYGTILSQQFINDFTAEVRKGIPKYA